MSMSWKNFHSLEIQPVVVKKCLLFFNLLFIFSLAIKSTCCSKDIFHGSTEAIERIMSAEKDITTAVHEYVGSLERRIILANR
jgi:hypothetical protein